MWKPTFLGQCLHEPIWSRGNWRTQLEVVGCRAGICLISRGRLGMTWPYLKRSCFRLQDDRVTCSAPNWPQPQAAVYYWNLEQFFFLAASLLTAHPSRKMQICIYYAFYKLVVFPHKNGGLYTIPNWNAQLHPGTHLWREASVTWSWWGESRMRVF